MNRKSKRSPGAHLCGSYNDPERRCPHLLYVRGEDIYPRELDEIRKGRMLKKFHLYCTADGKCRSLGCVATFTGNSPTWCPKRREVKEKNQ